MRIPLQIKYLSGAKKRGEVNNPEYWLKGKCNRYPKTAVLVEKQDSIQ
jgi:hypothetical protein